MTKYILDYNIKIVDNSIVHIITSRIAIENFKFALNYNKYFTIIYLKLMTDNFKWLLLEVIYEIFEICYWDDIDSCIFCFLHKKINDDRYNKLIYKVIINGNNLIKCKDNDCVIDESFTEIQQDYISQIEFQLNKVLIKPISSIIVDTIFNR
jgi:hypothetical protein